MGNCLAMWASWCFCSALGSLCNSCCGNDKPSSVPPSVTSGRKRSVFLLLLSIGISFAFQYGVAPSVTKYSNEFGPLGWIGRAWLEGCEEYDATGDLRKVCTGQAGVYRAAFSAFVFFILAAIGAYCKPTSNREAWVAKYFLFICLAVGTIFIPNEPLFRPIFMNIFRVGSVLFTIFNQLIILDMCFNVNESWVAKADKADIEEEPGAGKKWLIALIALSASLYLASFVAIGLMYAFFSGCTNNLVFITITLIMGIFCTFMQLTGEEASLFTSASIFTYATYLLYVTVSKHPDGTCNPQLGKDDILGMVLGIGLTLIGVLWTGFSSTAYKAVGDESDEKHVETDGENGESSDGNVQGVALADDADQSGVGTTDVQTASDDPVTFSTSWKMNIILAAITCWYAMVLTSWGIMSGSGTVGNPQAGTGNMWLVISSQWLIYLLYLWTLVAPKLFPDRDFS